MSIRNVSACFAYDKITTYEENFLGINHPKDEEKEKESIQSVHTKYFQLSLYFLILYRRHCSVLVNNVPAKMIKKPKT